MRRNTMTPARSRLSVAPSSQSQTNTPMNNSQYNTFRNVRDPEYIATSVQMINNYLSDTQIQQLTINCPSYKHFQQVFISLIGYFSPQTKYTNFSEEAHAMIKSMKYPFSSELNKSHLITTNPHSWPVILAFLRWTVEMIEICSSHTDCDDTDLMDGYRKFMEGIDDHLEQKMRNKANRENSEILEEMEILTNKKDELENEINTLKQSDLSVLKNKMSDLMADKYSIENNFIPLDQKEAKYRENIQILQNQIENLALENFKETKAQLSMTLNIQKEKMKDYKEQSKKKTDLISELERIKKEKEKMFHLLSEIEHDVSERAEMIEKYENDLHKVTRNENFHLFSENLQKMVPETNSDDQLLNTAPFSFTDIPVTKPITPTIDHLNDLISQLEDNLTLSNDALTENGNSLKNIKNENANKNKRIISLSRLYLEKKEFHELDSIRSTNEMTKIENELMTLYSESGNSLLQSEQALQYNNIKREKVESHINMEEAQINLVINKFYNEMVAELETIIEINESI